MRTGGIALLAAAAVALWAGLDPPRAWGQEERRPQTAEEALEALLIVSLRRELALETVEAVELAEKLRRILEAKRDFAREQGRLRRELALAMEPPEPDGERIQELIGAIFELRSRFTRAQQEAFERVTAEMEPVQKARLLILLEHFEERVRRHLRRFREGQRRRRPERDRPPFDR